MTDTQHHAPASALPPREPEILRASRLQDLLASVPSLLGIRPEESLVVVPFLGSRAGGGFRFALPEQLGRSDVETLARGCTSALAAVPEATSALVVVYTGGTYASSDGVPLLSLGRAVLRRLEHTDLGIVAVACVAGDGWGRYTDSAECRRPRPLLEIDGSETGLLARAVAAEPLDLGRLAELPVVEEADRAVVAEVLRRSRTGVEDVVPLVERWLTEGSTPLREGLLIRILQSPPLRDQTTLQIARGAASAERARSLHRRLEAVSARTGESVPAVVEREYREGDGGTDAHEAATLLTGTGAPPDRDRLSRATTALARAAALAPVEARSAVLTVLAWCWWARGVSSLASTHLDEALRLDPADSMARLYASLFAVRRLPEWVLDAASESLTATARRP